MKTTTATADRHPARRGSLRLVRDDERAEPKPDFPPAPATMPGEQIGADAEAFAHSEYAQDEAAKLIDAHGHDPAALAAELIWFGFEQGAFAESRQTTEWKIRYEGLRDNLRYRGVTA